MAEPEESPGSRGHRPSSPSLQQSLCGGGNRRPAGSLQHDVAGNSCDEFPPPQTENRAFFGQSPDPVGAEVNWIPLLPGIYGARVCPSTDFDDEFTYVTSYGVSIPPDDDIMQSWVDEIIPSPYQQGCQRFGPHHQHTRLHSTGDFWGTRSVCVRWTDGTKRSYRAGEDGYYDIMMQYEGGEVFDSRIFEWWHERANDLLTARTAFAYDIMWCEERLLQSRALRKLRQGYPMAAIMAHLPIDRVAIGKGTEECPLPSE